MTSRSLVDRLSLRLLTFHKAVRNSNLTLAVKITQENLTRLGFDGGSICTSIDVLEEQVASIFRV